MAHSMGPWKRVSDEVRSFDGAVICQVYAVDADATKRGRPVADANSRLLAAAPEMLDALRELANIGEAGVIERRETGKPTWSALDAIKSIARAALAKAE